MVSLFENLVWVFFGLTIFLFISSIIFKNKNSLIVNKLLSIFNIVYTFLLIFIVPIIFGLQSKIGYLLFYFGFVINLIVNIITIIITSVRLKKVKELKKITLYNIFKSAVIILPVVLIIGEFFIELRIIDKADIIFVHDYQNGIVDYRYYNYAVNKDCYKEFDISPKFKGKEKAYLENTHMYSFDVVDNVVKIDNSYYDDDYKKLNIEKLNKIILESGYIDGIIEVIDDSDYMIISFYSEDNNDKEIIYKNYEMITEIYSFGNFVGIYIYE